MVCMAGVSAAKHVHIDVLPAMTGVSRFGEAGAPWTYSKVSPNSLLSSKIAFLAEGGGGGFACTY